MLLLTMSSCSKQIINQKKDCFKKIQVFLNQDLHPKQDSKHQNHNRSRSLKIYAQRIPT